MNKNNIRKQIFTNIFEYSNIFEYLKIIKSQVTATYQSEDCGQEIKTFLELSILLIMLNI